MEDERQRDGRAGGVVSQDQRGGETGDGDEVGPGSIRLDGRKGVREGVARPLVLPGTRQHGHGKSQGTDDQTQLNEPTAH